MIVDVAFSKISTVFATIDTLRVTKAGHYRCVGFLVAEGRKSIGFSPVGSTAGIQWLSFLQLPENLHIQRPAKTANNSHDESLN